MKQQQEAERQQDNQPIFLFELLARGIGQEQSRTGMWEWFDLAHDFIIQTFVNLT